MGFLGFDEVGVVAGVAPDGVEGLDAGEGACYRSTKGGVERGVVGRWGKAYLLLSSSLYIHPFSPLLLSS